MIYTRSPHELKCPYYRLTSQPISDSIWLTGGSLVVGAGHQIFRFDSAKSLDKGPNRRTGLFEHVARLNGPLQDYHPQMILQCLLWGKILSKYFSVTCHKHSAGKLELVKKIITRLYKNVMRMDRVASYTYEQWQHEPIESFLSRVSQKWFEL